MPSGYVYTNSQALLIFKASMIYSSVASGLPIKMFFLIVVLNNTGS
jgi:hypothetical protein